MHFLHAKQYISSFFALSMSISSVILLVAVVTGFLAGVTLKLIFFKRIPSLFRSAIPGMALQLMHAENLQALISANGTFEPIRPLAEEHIDDFLKNKLGKEMPMIGMFIGEKTIAQLKTVFMKELEEIFPLIMNAYIKNLSGDQPKQMFVHRLVSGQTDTQIMGLLGDTIKKYTIIFPLWGLITGLLIGTLQLFILFWLA